MFPFNNVETGGNRKNLDFNGKEMRFATFEWDVDPVSVSFRKYYGVSKESGLFSLWSLSKNNGSEAVTRLFFLALSSTTGICM